MVHQRVSHTINMPTTSTLNNVVDFDFVVDFHCDLKHRCSWYLIEMLNCLGYV